MIKTRQNMSRESLSLGSGSILDQNRFLARKISSNLLRNGHLISPQNDEKSIFWAPQWPQTPKVRRFKYKIYPFSSFLGFILPKTAQNCTFYANLVQKMTIFEAFGKFWLKNGVKSAFLVSFRQNKSHKWWKHVKICLKRSFSWVWVHLGPKSVSGA